MCSKKVKLICVILSIVSIFVMIILIVINKDSIKYALMKSTGRVSVEKYNFTKKETEIIEKERGFKLSSGENIGAAVLSPGKDPHLLIWIKGIRNKEDFLSRCSGDITYDEFITDIPDIFTERNDEYGWNKAEGDRYYSEIFTDSGTTLKNEICFYESQAEGELIAYIFSNKYPGNEIVNIFY